MDWCLRLKDSRVLREEWKVAYNLQGLEKAYKVDREAPSYVLKIYGVGGELLEEIKAIYREESACLRVESSVKALL